MGTLTVRVEWDDTITDPPPSVGDVIDVLNYRASSDTSRYIDTPEDDVIRIHTIVLVSVDG